MNILDKITTYKHKEVAEKRATFPLHLLEKSAHFERETQSLTRALKNAPTGIIAEYKRRSPSKPRINLTSQIQDVAKSYKTAGASGMSVLTDTQFFGGSLDDLLVARNAASFPILRKEFIIDAYQVYEAKAFGADAILLIAACLTAPQIKEFSELAKQLQLDVLLEIHNEQELQKSLIPSIDMIGVNNRNLKTFETSIETSKLLANLIPDEFLKVSESGISTLEAISELKTYGYQGFLIGENFMKTDHPGQCAKEFIDQLP